jgi:hypothetical protein
MGDCWLPSMVATLIGVVVTRLWITYKEKR